MDVHPIPQNVTSFQFKLVGDMTLKQFGYLAAGLGIAYAIFITAVYNYPFVAWPLIILSALSGIGFAFVPIGSRPLDYWLKAFLKAIYSPTKRVWNKNGKTFKEDALFQSRLVMYFSGQQPQQSTVYGLPSTAISNIPAEVGSRKSEVIAPLPTKDELKKTVDLAREAQQLQMKIIQTERTLSQIKTASEKPTPIPVDYSQQVNAILSDLQHLMNQASSVKQRLQSVKAPESQQTANLAAAALSREKVKVVVSNKPKQATIALTTFPNIINGIIKDSQNNYLEGVVAVIYDKEGLPVRALKTNKLGQFTGSTPLPNGTYTLELEKDNFNFDVLQIELTGQILQPLPITAK